ncbi:MAG: hypothetical protein DIU80_021745 [Chloroflexota bacterium]
MRGVRRAQVSAADGLGEERLDVAYTGETTRLDLGGQHARGGGSCEWSPWWTLWLIWPAIGLLKWTAPRALDMYATLVEASAPLLPALLILVGVALIARRRRE